MSGEELKPADCPFCGAGLEGPLVSVDDRVYWMHPGVVTDGKCFFSGQGIYSPQLAAWNRRAHPLPEHPQEWEDREVMFEVWQDDMMVASSTDEADAIHYLAVYAQDGPAKLMRAETVRTTLATETKEGGDA